MLQIRRLNMDSSWQIQWDETCFLLDPWLLASEIAGFSWFSEQWHKTKPLPLNQVGDYQAIVISQPFADHCHIETLQNLKPAAIYASPKILKGLRPKLIKYKDFVPLPRLKDQTVTQLHDIQIIRLLDKNPTVLFQGLVFKKKEELIVYFPHGFTPTKPQLEFLKKYTVKLLITSFSRFKLPFFLGGAVNKGKANAMELIEELQPLFIVPTHDEDKHAKGLVKKIAKLDYPDWKALQKEIGSHFLPLDQGYIFETIK
ncbi:MAG: MBL fold metallo-hydrolase [Saprospiraceae bacterium]|nr:MBL fold metallo-hydrolase [Saprospiraceae bacterium]